MFLIRLQIPKNPKKHSELFTPSTDIGLIFVIKKLFLNFFLCQIKIYDIFNPRRNKLNANYKAPKT